jgi:outer membrane protein assembly factor BamB
MPKSTLLYIGIKGSVLALDRATGEQVWNTPLKGSEFVNVAVDDGDLYATARGEIYCLNAATGQIRWKNGLTGYGLGLISIAAAGGNQVVLSRERQRREDDAASAASTA